MQGKALTPEQEEELLSKLIMADFSLKKAQALLEQIKEKGNNVDVIREVLLSEAPPFEPLRDTSVPSVFFIIGVNGVGKTTTVAKLAHMYAKQGKNVVVVGADTFRAAAQDQLSTLVNRMPVTYVGGSVVRTAVPFFTRPFQRTRRRLFFWLTQLGEFTLPGP